MSINSETSYADLDGQSSHLKEALLQHHEINDSGDSFGTANLPSPRRRADRLKSCSILANIVLSLAVAILTIILRIPNQQTQHQPLPLSADVCTSCDKAYTPLRHLITHQQTTFTADLDVQTPYKGQPTPAIEAAWSNIASVGMIRLTPSDLTALNRTTYHLHPTLGGQGMGFIAVFHQLHCIDILRRGVQEWHYGHRPDSSGGYHLDHCLDVLRQAAMCHADTNILTWDWVPGMSLPVANGTVEHTCRDFERVFEWTRERSVAFGDVQESARLHNEEAGVEVV